MKCWVYIYIYPFQDSKILSRIFLLCVPNLCLTHLNHKVCPCAISCSLLFFANDLVLLGDGCMLVDEILAGVDWLRWVTPWDTLKESIFDSYWNKTTPNLYLIFGCVFFVGEFPPIGLTYCSLKSTSILYYGFYWLQRGVSLRSVYECNFGWSFVEDGLLVARWIGSN